jgi:hypothetical protein
MPTGSVVKAFQRSQALVKGPLGEKTLAQIEGIDGPILLEDVDIQD